MPYVNVHIDVEDVLDECSISELERALKRKKKDKTDEVIAQSIVECSQTLDDAAFALRKAGIINLAWRLDEIRHDYFKVEKK